MTMDLSPRALALEPEAEEHFGFTEPYTEMSPDTKDQVPMPTDYERFLVSEFLISSVLF